MGKTIQAISLIMTHRTEDPAKLPPVIPAAAASANVGVSARAVVRKVLDPSRPKLRLGGARPLQAEEGGSGGTSYAEVTPAADVADGAGGAAAANDAAPMLAEEPHGAHADGASLCCRSRIPVTRIRLHALQAICMTNSRDTKTKPRSCAC